MFTSVFPLCFVTETRICLLTLTCYNCADLTALAQALDSEQAHTSFGKLPLSVEPTAAQYSFTQANRWDGCKMFDNQLTKTENIGKNAPGPQYKYDDKIKYGEVSITTAPNTIDCSNRSDLTIHETVIDCQIEANVDFVLFDSLPDKLSLLRKEWRPKSPSTTSMRTLSSSMTPFRLITTGSLKLAHLKSVLSQGCSQTTWSKTQVPNTTLRTNQN